jgi:predicted enzyme related to lactoylglutathione lyase
MSAMAKKKAKKQRPAKVARRTQTKRKATKKRGSARRASPMFQKVAFTTFAVKDARRARAFYEDVLGLKRGLASDDGVWTEYDLPGGGCLALFYPPEPKYARPPGGASVAFEVADLDALNERLKAAGVVYEHEMIYGPECRMSGIVDSEGNSIILHELNRRR